MAASYEGADFALQSAYLIAGVALAHAFVDGTKRIAYATAALCWALNGMMLPAGAFSERTRTIEALLASSERDAAIGILADWLRARLIAE